MFGALIVGVEMKLYIWISSYEYYIFCVFTMSKDTKSRGKLESNSESVEFKSFMRDKI